MTDITELAQRARINAECGKHLSPDETIGLVEELEKAQAENTAGVAGMAESYETIISMLRSRIAELESRTVTFKLPSTPEPSAFAPWVAKAFYQFHRDTVKSCFAVFSDACAVAGIKVEAE